jgi:hypothetical protein
MPIGRKKQRGKIMSERRKYVSKKKMSGNVNYRGWKDWDIGDIVVGKLTRFVTDKFGKQCPVLEVEDCFFKDKKAVVAAGDCLQLNYSKILGEGILPEHIGEIFQVELTGFHTIKNGPYKGKETPLFEIDIMGLEGEEESESEETDLDL